MSINPNKNSILTPQRPDPDVRLGYTSTGQSKIMREEMVEARRHLAQLNPLIFAPSEKAPRGIGIGAAGVGNNRVHI